MLHTDKLQVSTKNQELMTFVSSNDTELACTKLTGNLKKKEPNPTEVEPITFFVMLSIDIFSLNDLISFEQSMT